MMKWFRAHTKQIMAFLVLVAMFSFVGGSALVTFLTPDPSKEIFGSAYGKEFNVGQIQGAQRDIEIIKLLTPSVPTAYAAMFGEIWQFGRKDLRFEHWYLLAKEAERAGIEVSDKEIDDQLQGFPAEFFESLRVQHHVTLPEIHQALRRFIAIRKNGMRVSNAAVPSEAEVRHFVHDTQDKIKVQFVALDAQKFVDEKDAVSPEELQAHFEKHKDEDPSKSEDGFGYKYPRRVKLQYVVAEIPKIAPGIEISLDAVKSAWKSNKSKYKKTIYVDPPTSAPATSGPTSQPDKPKPVPQSVEKSFSEARADVERGLRQKAAVQAAEQAMRKIQSQLQRPWLDEKTDPTTGYKPIPASAKEPGAMQAAGDKYAKEFNISLEYGETSLISKEELAKLPALGRMKLAGGSASEGSSEDLTIEEYAFRIPEFFAHTTGSETLPSLQLFQVPDLPLTDAMRIQTFTIPANRYVLFRVVESREAEAPANLEEVRPAVERDVRLIKAFARIEPLAKEFMAASVRLGVEKALDLFPDLRDKHGAVVSTPPPFARLQRLDDERLRRKFMSGESTVGPSNIPGVGTSKEFIDACFEMTAAGWTGPAFEAPQTDRTKSATTRPAVVPTPKLNLVSLPKLRKWFVVELAGTEPVDEGQYQSKLRQEAQMNLQSERNLVLQSEWFMPTHVEKRCGFVRVIKEGDLPPREGIAPPPQF